MSTDTLEGSARRVTFYNPDNGYTVLRLKPTSPIPAAYADAVDNTGLVTVVGIMPQIAVGELLDLRGEWAKHSEYGQQFQAASVQRKLPTSPEAIARYLKSKIKGVGMLTATAIVEHFGVETLTVLDHEPERLYEVDGVGRHRVRQIIKGWAAQKADQEMMMFLQGNGLPTTLAMRVQQEYGDEVIALIEEDPYRMYRDIYGIGFRIADQFAQRIGFTGDHPARLKAGVAFALEQAVSDGHMFLPEEELIASSMDLLSVGEHPIRAALTRALNEEILCTALVPLDEDTVVQAIYLPVYYYAEIGAANRLRRILENPRSRVSGLEKLGLPRLIADVAVRHDVNLTVQQQQAIEAAIVNKVSILTGGPGTGKTTTLRTLIELLRVGQQSFALASPTGRAAKRLSEATGQPASTIHRLLGFSAMGEFAMGEDQPLNFDMVIIDEASMLDVVLANALIRALDPRSHLLLVGDVDQLPSVGAGDVLRDLIASGEVPVTRLATIFRQGAGSMIVSNAHRINQGEAPIADEKAEDFFHFRIADDAERAADLIVDVVNNRIPERFAYDPIEDIQVLVPMYRGAAGVNALNEKLQHVLNPSGRSAEKEIGGRIFRVGDKVIQTRNNYDKNVFNGDIGRVRTIDFNEKTISIAFDDTELPVEYDWGELSDVTHAYAISVHRSQGSEYPAVVMPVLTQHYMLLQRNLLYTSITRARRLVVLVGSDRAINIAVQNDTVSHRYTALAQRLRGQV